jgi:hypothetical protein
MHKKIIFTLFLVGILFTLAFSQPALTSVDARVLNIHQQTTPSPPVEEAIPSGPPLSLTLSLLCFCLAFSLLIGVFVLGIFVRRSGGIPEKEEHGL